MSLLTIVQDAADQLGLDQPSSVASNTDPTIVQMLRLANAEGRALAKRGTWQQLMMEATFSAAGNESTTGKALSAITADLSRDNPLIKTMWNRTQNRYIEGPIGMEEWQAVKGTDITTGFYKYIIFNDTLYITPDQTASDDIYFAYISTLWCESSGGTGQAAWNADADVGRLPEELMTLGLVWRWRKAKGLDYGEDYMEYEAQVSDALSKSGSKPIINMGPSNVSRLETVIGPYVTRSF